MMTVTAARGALMGNLSKAFGDPRLIDAAHFLLEVEDACDAIARCRHGVCSVCRGSGCFHSVDGALCWRCGGDGRSLGCLCFVAVRGEAVIAARGLLNADPS
jgi:hypothetical protein